MTINCRQKMLLYACSRYSYQQIHRTNKRSVGDKERGMGKQQKLTCTVLKDREDHFKVAGEKVCPRKAGIRGHYSFLLLSSGKFIFYPCHLEPKKLE